MSLFDQTARSGAPAAANAVVTVPTAFAPLVEIEVAPWSKSSPHQLATTDSRPATHASLVVAVAGPAPAAFVHTLLPLASTEPSSAPEQRERGRVAPPWPLPPNHKLNASGSCLATQGAVEIDFSSSPSPLKLQDLPGDRCHDRCREATRPPLLLATTHRQPATKRRPPKSNPKSVGTLSVGVAERSCALGDAVEAVLTISTLTFAVSPAWPSLHTPERGGVSGRYSGTTGSE